MRDLSGVIPVTRAFMRVLLRKIGIFRKASTYGFLRFFQVFLTPHNQGQNDGGSGVVGEAFSAQVVVCVCRHGLLSVCGLSCSRWHL